METLLATADENANDRHALQVSVEVRCHIGVAQFQVVVSRILEALLFRGTIGKKRWIEDDKAGMGAALLLERIEIRRHSLSF